MKLGEIKIEAIKLMFVNYDFDMVIEDLQRMISDGNYGSYIVNMNGSIARALDRIQNACVVPIRSFKIKNEDFVSTVWRKCFDTSKIDDLYLIDRVTCESACGYDGNCSYEMVGGNITLPNSSDGEYTVLYYPKIKTVNETVGDTAELWIPDHIARLIPLYIKGDLYQEEEPNLAADARNTFEASLDDLKSTVQSKQNRIERVI
jgi:hypothetical protein